jgi:hypothetical protein
MCLPNLLRVSRIFVLHRDITADYPTARQEVRSGLLSLSGRPLENPGQTPGLGRQAAAQGPSDPFRAGAYNRPAVRCPLCGVRKARRSCPAIGQQICALCCGTKRLSEIRCPADCGYLQSAREHPAASIVRQQERDVAILSEGVRDLSGRQSELFLVIAAFLTEHKRSGLQAALDEDVTDEDVIDAAASLAATFQTSARGVIYEHRPASFPASRLVSAIKPLLAEAGRNGGSAFERDAAFVFEKIGEAAARTRSLEPSNRRAFIELLRRTVRKPNEDPAPAAASEPPRLILP